MVVSYMVATIILTISRAWDYATPFTAGEPPPRPALAAIEAVMPLWAWALVIAIPTIGLIAAMIWHVHAGVWLGLGLIAVAYAALGVGLTAEYLGRPWGDGIRSGIEPLYAAYIAGSLCLLTGWRPPAWTPSR